ncbi:MAG: type III-B CRISPR module-associated Cmr3 family protein [SAR324 cluster bacterium]|jgi:CRISPR-associated protein Cmr3|nr:type III-B CRISPR module-associated Cmr3 family protein [SAR324 cluster bacterium]
MRQSIEITPVDTLFFRGAEAMKAGENHHPSTLFPPMPQTVLGALRTAMLAQQGIPFMEFNNGSATGDKAVLSLLGKPKKAGFALAGPLFGVEDAQGRKHRLLPVPAHWYADMVEFRQARQQARSKQAPAADLNVCLASPQPEAARQLGLCSSLSNGWRWATPRASGELQRLAGFWMTENALGAPGRLKQACHLTQLSDAPTLLELSTLYDVEERTGIARNAHLGTVRDGHLYTARHLRLRPGVNLVVLADRSLPPALTEQGILQLGGEQRTVSYLFGQAASSSQLTESAAWLALGPIPSRTVQEHGAVGFASGSLLRVGGWDFQTRFHKPLEGWHPAGTVLFFDQPQPVPHGFRGLPESR